MNDMLIYWYKAMLNLIGKINQYYKLSLGQMTYVSPDDNKFNSEEDFDIKDSNLYNLFEIFTNISHRILEELSEADSNVSYEELASIARQLQNLNNMGKDITNSSYLISDDYQEDFEPDDLVKFVSNTITNLKERADALTDNFDENKENEFSNEFQSIEDDKKLKGGVEDKFTADKRERNRLHQAAHRERMKFLKFQNPEAYTNWYDKQRLNVKNFRERLLNDPIKSQEYKLKSKENFKLWRQKLLDKKIKIEKLLPTLKDQKQIELVTQELNSVNNKLNSKKISNNIRSDLKKLDGLAGSVERILTKCHSYLSDKKKDINKKLILNPNNKVNYEIELKQAAQDIEQIKQFAKLINKIVFPNIKKKDKKELINVDNQNDINNLIVIGNSLIEEFKSIYPNQIRMVEQAITYLTELTR